MSEEPRLYLYRKCNHCGGEVVHHSLGDEGWSVCTDCESIEGGSTDVWLDEDGNEVSDKTENLLDAAEYALETMIRENQGHRRSAKRLKKAITEFKQEKK